jgi:tetratricopeptide (TPR) repeat protein
MRATSSRTVQPIRYLECVTTEGELLSDRLQRGPLPLDQAIAIALQIATALAAAHAVSMIHRTLEPGNILLAGDTVKLLDFGIASAVRPASAGAARYLAPECTSTTQADRRSDVYALGCIVLEMACGQVPGEGAHPDLPAQLAATLTAMRARDPAARPTMAEVVQQLAAPPAVAATYQELHAELERYTAAKQWTKVVETIERILELETDPVRRASYSYTAGTICRDELDAREAAIDHYDAALDSWFGNPEPIDDARLPLAMRGFDAIDRLTRKHGEWKLLERAHRKMLYRLKHLTTPAYLKLQATLFDKLGEIYRTRLEVATAALSAFECAEQLDPENQAQTEGIDRAAILAELRSAT